MLAEGGVLAEGEEFGGGRIVYRAGRSVCRGRCPKLLIWSTEGFAYSLSSESSSSIISKSAPPTPTIMIDIGRADASTMAALV